MFDIRHVELTSLPATVSYRRSHSPSVSIYCRVGAGCRRPCSPSDFGYIQLKNPDGWPASRRVDVAHVFCFFWHRYGSAAAVSRSLRVACRADRQACRWIDCQRSKRTGLMRERDVEINTEIKASVTCGDVGIPDHAYC